MVIQIDTREKQHAITRIIKTFDDFLEDGITYISSKLYVGDYMLYGHPEVIIDRKQNVGEICSNICGKQHKRFSEELKKAKEVNSHMIILIEDDSISCIDDIKNWSSTNTKVKGETLLKAIRTMESEKDKYDVEFRCCKKVETGEQIIKILMEEGN